MLQTVEAIVDKNGVVRLLEPVHIQQNMRAIVTLVEPTENSTDDINDAQFLLTLAGMFESGTKETSSEVNAIVSNFLLQKHESRSHSCTVAFCMPRQVKTMIMNC